MTPSRLKFDLTQKKESGIILGLIAMLMVFTLLTEAFYVAGGGAGPHAVAPVGGALGSALSGSVSAEAANVLQQSSGKKALWDCLTCGACVEECPVGVEHISTIIDMRRFLVMERRRCRRTAMNAHD
ncbi:Probable iron-sulfur-binding oxidoreductase FadF [Geodia barretti]|uniref:Probable iron-sulfur-binding oxidoreductase FadF n=1 Tax=Geodia barretti TaxID=519541 RepID=A0AA35RDN1_GEOBA|nr:Probable iron-sulfur-binding oxidoreductase FadF [Geodia barretti]